MIALLALLGAAAQTATSPKVILSKKPALPLQIAPPKRVGASAKTPVAQLPPPKSSPTEVVKKPEVSKEALPVEASAIGPNANLFGSLTPRALGPTIMGGRVTGLAVFEKDPSIFYVASASGGIFKTVNNGITFDALFDRENSVSLGAIAVDQHNSDLVWAGTGEATSRNSVAWGDGIYKSVDGGKTWKNMGLKETMHIAKIAIDPRNPNVVYVAALGRLWGANPERGLYKTTDGGKTWKLILSADDRTGAVDVELDPKDPNTLLVSMWQRLRKPYDFISGGPGSALYRSTNGGQTFHSVKGLPQVNLGRIGISFFRKDSKVVLATVEYKPDPKKEKFPADNGQVKYYAGGTFRSTDNGETWQKVNPLNPRPFYFSNPVQSPTDVNRIYILGDEIWASDDAAKTIKSVPTTTHPDIHACWIDPNNDRHIIIGCDGGIFTSYDRGLKWEHIRNLPIGQFYAVAVDFRQPYWIYGGLQDNQCWGIPTQNNGEGVSWFNAVSLPTGDGFYCQVDPNEWNVVYYEGQGCGLIRRDFLTGERKFIRPSSPLVKSPRFNWSTPFILSPFNSKTLYVGSNVLFKSVDRGNHWLPISPDLSTNNAFEQTPGKYSVTPEDTGAERHCTITTVAASSQKQGLLWAGTDDGNLQVSTDEGQTWTNVAPNIKGLPRETWCSRIIASKWSADRAYATFDGHRSNDFKSYLFVTEDLGKTWKKLSEDLPDYDCLYVIREGEKNPDLLYLGSEKSLRFSLDRGATWNRFRNGFPTVAVHDLLVHPRDLDLVIGTHGRGLWTLDVSGLEDITQAALTKDVELCDPRPIFRGVSSAGRGWTGDNLFTSPDTQGTTHIYYYLGKPAKDVSLTISEASGKGAREISGAKSVGLNAILWDGELNGYSAGPGTYRVVLKVDGKEFLTQVKVTGAEVPANIRRYGQDEDNAEAEGGNEHRN